MVRPAEVPRVLSPITPEHRSEKDLWKADSGGLRAALRSALLGLEGGRGAGCSAPGGEETRVEGARIWPADEKGLVTDWRTDIPRLLSLLWACLLITHRLYKQICR